VSVNEERVVGTTAIHGTGSAVLINATRVTAPFEVRAIGSPDRLERLLADPAVLRGLKAAAVTYGLGFRVSRERDLPLPAFSGAFPQRVVSLRGNP
jgi:uncharacterized protein YlxW (UPF0749 family)